MRPQVLSKNTQTVGRIPVQYICKSQCAPVPSMKGGTLASGYHPAWDANLLFPAGHVTVSCDYACAPITLVPQLFNGQQLRPQHPHWPHRSMHSTSWVHMHNKNSPSINRTEKWSDTRKWNLTQGKKEGTYSQNWNYIQVTTFSVD